MIDAAFLAHARAAKGFMPDDEGLALFDLGVRAAQSRQGPLLEVGSYCGKSAVYLGAAIRAAERGPGSPLALFSVDHHHGSEENQAGWEHHDTTVVDPRTRRMDTLPFFRRTIEDAGLEDVVIAIVGHSTTVARWWTTPLALLFIDGGHGADIAAADYRGWAPHVAVGGLLVIHDVFPDPANGGQAPYEQVYLPATASGRFTERPELCCGSLRVLEAIRPPNP